MFGKYLVRSIFFFHFVSLEFIALFNVKDTEAFVWLSIFVLIVSISIIAVQEEWM